MTEIEQVIGKLAAAGVTLRIENDRLRYSSAPGCYTAELRELVAKHREGLLEHLQWDGVRASITLAEVIRLTASTGPESGLTRVLTVYRKLAEQWYESQDQRLYEVIPGVEAAIERWIEQAGQWHLPKQHQVRHQ